MKYMFLWLTVLANTAFQGSDSQAQCSGIRVMGIQSANFMAGQIEICTGGEWRAVCHSSWDVNDAMVVCRQLGFPSEGALFCRISCFGKTQRPGLYNFGCNGDEVQLQDCLPVPTSIMRCGEAAGVVCTNRTLPPDTPEPCTATMETETMTNTRTGPITRETTSDVRTTPSTLTETTTNDVRTTPCTLTETITNDVRTTPSTLTETTTNDVRTTPSTLTETTTNDVRTTLTETTTNVVSTTPSTLTETTTNDVRTTPRETTTNDVRIAPITMETALPTAPSTMETVTTGSMTSTTAGAGGGVRADLARESCPSLAALGGGLGALSAILAILLVGVVMGWVWSCRRRTGKSEFQEKVAFQNPIYNSTASASSPSPAQYSSIGPRDSHSHLTAEAPAPSPHLYTAVKMSRGERGGGREYEEVPKEEEKELTYEELNVAPAQHAARSIVQSAAPVISITPAQHATQHPPTETEYSTLHHQ